MTSLVGYHITRYQGVRVCGWNVRLALLTLPPPAVVSGTVLVRLEGPCKEVPLGIPTPVHFLSLLHSTRGNVTCYLSLGLRHAYILTIYHTNHVFPELDGRARKEGSLPPSVLKFMSAALAPDSQRQLPS